MKTEEMKNQTDSIEETKNQTEPIEGSKEREVSFEEKNEILQVRNDFLEKEIERITKEFEDSKEVRNKIEAKLEEMRVIQEKTLNAFESTEGKEENKKKKVEKPDLSFF